MAYINSKKSKSDLNSGNAYLAVVGIAVDVDILEECGFKDTDFDDRIPKVREAQAVTL